MASVRSLGVFPFCPAEYDALTDALYYLPVNSLTEAMDAYWRVKTWQFAVTDGTLDTYTTDFSGTERNLVCDGIHHTASGTVGGGGPEMSWHIEVAAFEESTYVKKDGSQLYLRIFGELGDGSLFGEGVSTAERTGYLEFTFAADYGGYNLSIVVTPDEWHEYDPGDGGGPIYDFATGDKLRGFPL